jgi:hypothetical protein
MKQVAYLIIFIVVLFACNEKRKEQKTEIETATETPYYQQGINSDFLCKISWIKEDDDIDEGIFFAVELFQRNDSNFVSVAATLNPPLFSSYIFDNHGWIGFTNTEEDCLMFFGKVSDDFLTTIAQYDALNTSWEDLELLYNPDMPGRSSYTYTFFVDEYGYLILKQKQMI